MPFSHQPSLPQSVRTARQQGFTLIEIIIGMVMLSISLAIVINLIVPAEQQSADQVHLIKAAELGQSMLDEIQGRAFDHQSDHVGSRWRCDEPGRAPCTNDLGPEIGETSRSLFNDVDDYHGFNEKVNSTDDPLDEGYNSFIIKVAVSYDGDALDLSPRLAKRITVTITTPLNTAIAFTAYKSNF